MIRWLEKRGQLVTMGTKGLSALATMYANFFLNLPHNVGRSSYQEKVEMFMDWFGWNVISISFKSMGHRINCYGIRLCFGCPCGQRRMACFLIFPYGCYKVLKKLWDHDMLKGKLC